MLLVHVVMFLLVCSEGIVTIMPGSNFMSSVGSSQKLERFIMLIFFPSFDLSLILFFQSYGDKRNFHSESASRRTNLQDINQLVDFSISEFSIILKVLWLLASHFDK